MLYLREPEPMLVCDFAGRRWGEPTTSEWLIRTGRREFVPGGTVPPVNHCARCASTFLPLEESFIMISGRCPEISLWLPDPCAIVQSHFISSDLSPAAIEMCRN